MKDFSEGGPVGPRMRAYRGEGVTMSGGNSILPLPEMTVTNLEADRSPNLAERIVRVVLHIMAIITLALASTIMLLLLVSAARIYSAVQDIGTPDPVVTGCPIDDENCGG